MSNLVAFRRRLRSPRRSPARRTPARQTFDGDCLLLFVGESLLRLSLNLQTLLTGLDGHGDECDATALSGWQLFETPGDSVRAGVVVPGVVRFHEFQPLGQLRSQLDVFGWGGARIGDADGVRRLAFEITTRRASHSDGRNRGDDVKLGPLFGLQVCVAVGGEQIDDVSGLGGGEFQFDLPRLARA